MTIFSEEQFSSQNLGADAAKVEAWPKTKLWNVNGKKLTRSKFSTEEAYCKFAYFVKALLLEVEQVLGLNHLIICILLVLKIVVKKQ